MLALLPFLVPGTCAAQPPEVKLVEVVRSVAFSPDGKQVLTASHGKTAALWDVATGRRVRTFRGHAGFILSVAFRPDGKKALTGSEDKTAILWDAATGRKARTFKGHAHWVSSVAFSPDGKHVLTGSQDKTAVLWDATTGEKVHAWKTTFVHAVAFRNRASII
jgi:WD40 repeat protein